jgi:hypothetical protein
MFVGTLYTGYPYIQASSQDKLQAVHPHTVTCPTTLDLASQLRWDAVLPRVLWLRTSPLSWGGFRLCHVSYSYGSRLSAQVGSGAATCVMALDLTSRLRWAPVLPHALWLRTSSPSWGGLRRCHVSYDSIPHFSAEVGSGAVTSPIVSDLAFWLRWALALPRVLWLRTSPPDWSGLRCYHMSYGSGPRLLAVVGSDAATCHVSPDLASRLGRTPTLPRVPWLHPGHGFHA